MIWYMGIRYRQEYLGVLAYININKGGSLQAIAGLPSVVTSVKSPFFVKLVEMPQIVRFCGKLA